MPMLRDILELVPRDELLLLADSLELALPERRSKQPMVDALASFTGGTPGELLQLLSRDRLKELCYRLSLVSAGRDKASLVSCLVQSLDDENTAPQDTGGGQRVAPPASDFDVTSRGTKDRILQLFFRALEHSRGVVEEPFQMRVPLSVLLLLKRLDDVFQEDAIALLSDGAPPEVAYGSAEEHEFFIPAHTRWASLLKRSTPSQIDHDLNRMCLAIERANPKLTRILTSVDFEDERRMGSQPQRTSLLWDWVHSFSTLKLGNSDLENPSALGEIYTSLLEETASRAGGRSGSSVTPATIVKLMVELSAPEEGMSVCDPVCGTGGLLVGCAEYVHSLGGSADTLQLEGQEKQLDTWVLAQINLLLHGVRESRIVPGDTIREPRLVSGGRLNSYDRIIAKPPFSLRWWGHESAVHDSYGRFRYGIPPRDHGDFAFLQHMIAALKPGGRIVTTAPHGMLFRGKVEERIRSAILKDDLIEAVIGLPGGLFLGTSLPTAILVLSTSKPEERRNQVLFIDASQGFHDSRAGNQLRAEDISRILIAFREFSDISNYARVVSHEELEANDFSLAISRYVEARSAMAEGQSDHLDQMWRRIELKNYKSIAEASVELAPFSVVVGPNGSGKSNFADALVFAREIAVDAETAVERRGGLAGLRRRQPDEDAQVLVDIRAATSRTGLETDYVRHRFTIRSGGSARGWSFRNETIELFSRGEPVLRLERTPGGIELEPGRLAEAAGKLPKLSETASVMVFARQMELLTRRTALRNVTRIRLNPDAMRPPQSATENTRLDESGSNIAVALRSLGPEGQARVLTVMQRIVPGLLRIFVEPFDRFLLLRFEQQQSAGQVARFSTSEMSEGALRALGILVATQQMTRDELLVIEEPEVAIHLGAAQLLFDVLKEASTRGAVLITTHSADLLDAAREEEILVCSYREGVTHIGPLAASQREIVRQGLFTVAELMRSEPLRIEGEEPDTVQL